MDRIAERELGELLGVDVDLPGWALAGLDLDLLIGAAGVRDGAGDAVLDAFLSFEVFPTPDHCLCRLPTGVIDVQAAVLLVAGQG
ncbi:MAG: hypothetical protein ACRDK7_06015 [Solirubrobacteraceae bacterium]